MSGFTLKVEKARKSFGGLVAVNDVDLTVWPNSIHSIIGPNGAGKTTFFNLLTGVNGPDSGRVMIDDTETTRYQSEQVAACGVGRTFQNIRLFGAMTVLENVLVGHHVRINESYLSALLALPVTKREERRAAARCAELLDYMGLASRLGELAKNLSYGEQRRLEIARALAVEPRLLLLDEPAAGMNPKETDELRARLLAIRDDFDLTIVLIEHDMSMVMGLSDRITVLEYGSVIAEGVPDEIKRNERVIEAYLGRGKAGGLHAGA